MTGRATAPVICFGQQPCGFFPRRFLYAKILTARRLQAEIGGEVVFFCHDSDHDFRETRTTLRHRKTGEPLQLNFAFDNQVQRKFSPLYLKRIRPDWRIRTARIRRLRRPPLGRGVPTPSTRPTSPTSAWRCTAGWACLTASTSPARATRPSAARPATSTTSTSTCRTKARSCGPGWSRRGPGCTRAATSTWTFPTCRTPASRSARRETLGCAGCNR